MTFIPNFKMYFATMINLAILYYCNLKLKNPHYSICVFKVYLIISLENGCRITFIRRVTSARTEAR
jgi:hypothetical protein